MSSDDRHRLNQLASGARVFADSQQPLKKAVLNRGIDLIFALLMSLIERIEKLEERQP